MANPVLLGANNAPQAKSMMTALTGLVENGGRVGQIHSDRKVFTPITASVKSSAPSTDYNGYFKVIKASPLNKELPENTSQKEPYIWVYDANGPLPEDPHNLENFYSGYVITTQTGKRFDVPMTQLEVRKSSDEFIVLNIWEMGPIHVANITIGNRDTTITRPGVVRKIILAKITNMKFSQENNEDVISYSIEQMYLENEYIYLDIYTQGYRIAQVPVVGQERVPVDENDFSKQSWAWAVINGAYPEDFEIEAGTYFTTLGSNYNTIEFKTPQTFLDFSKIDVDEETGESAFQGTGDVNVYLNIISPDYKTADSAIVLSMKNWSDNAEFWSYYRRIGRLTFKDWMVTTLVQQDMSDPTVVGRSSRQYYAFRINRLVSYLEGEPGKPVYKIEVIGGRVELGVYSHEVEGKSFILNAPHGSGLSNNYPVPNLKEGEEIISESGTIYLKVYIDESNFRGEILFNKNSEGNLPSSSLELEILPLASVNYDTSRKLFIVADYDHDFDYTFDLDKNRWG